MNSSFSQALELSGMSSATAIVVWTMIIFLITLILGIGIFFKKQIDKKQSQQNTSFISGKKGKGKGF
tara:strand:+ start:208 stop:408 length:201 start_codon:yes stop_codon:yes gene_type:complete